ncbi:UvrD/REP helicase [Rhodococcus rhodochrous]|uniref:UvrD-helicase domain-containing protein n=1 Tax=Rhodococcus rhodochrous TaxID=1829 RepID=UPI00075166C1|nr:UvrD-helicase domain-containing protein [Rhodococcus rhodochrous]MDO1485897.1 AAA family ATPase [Rhodococcus rhodochrous]SNV16122.1 UvrD/REP helicase [Rhodococcus rhodochrous]
MASLAIDKDFLLDFAELDQTVQSRVYEVFGKFDAATHAGLHLEKIKNARNPHFRSIRITQFWRGIVLAPQKGDVYTLLKVLPHDDAYVWAERRNISVNRVNGRIEVRDDITFDEQLAQLDHQPRNFSTRYLFEHIKDSELVRLGLDDKAIRFARLLTDDSQLEAAQPFFPSIQWQVLYGLAAGMTPDEVWADLGAAILDGPVDTNDLDTAIKRSSDRVLLVDGPAEMMAVFANPFALWRIYLHPAQQSVVDAAYRGPSRVAGGPGTGKTVVALHRARRLAARGEGPVLVTTFTSTLADSLKDGIGMLVKDPDVMSRIVVQHVDRLAHRVFREEHGNPRILSPVDEKKIWRSIIDDFAIDFSEAFLGEEWRQVILAQRVSSASEYLAAKRTGRGRRLGATQKAQVWQVVWEFEEALKTRKLHTHDTIRREATRILEQQTDKPYRHIVVDEAQDLSPDQWRLLRAAVADGPDDLFLAGDTHQRIYNNHVSLRELGVNVTGRSSRLSINYRTTAEILRWSLGLMRGCRIDDMNDNLDSIAGCRSDIHGDAPEVRGFSTRDAEFTYIAEKVRDWLDSGVSPSEIGIAARSKKLCEALAVALSKYNIPTSNLSDSRDDTDNVAIGTMHRMKGLEFRCLVVGAVTDRQLPAPYGVTPASEDEHTHERDLQRERSLLFVACTRAREQLLVTWHGDPSPFLVPIL